MFEDSFSPKFQANICSNSLLDVKEENNISQVLDFFSMGILFFDSSCPPWFLITQVSNRFKLLICFRSNSLI